jgi:hypothetical protein
MAHYHCISRVVNREFVFGDVEREQFVQFMREYEAFCGVRVLTYCILSNHFHILVEVPESAQGAARCGGVAAEVGRVVGHGDDRGHGPAENGDIPEGGGCSGGAGVLGTNLRLDVGRECLQEVVETALHPVVQPAAGS